MRADASGLRRGSWQRLPEAASFHSTVARGMFAPNGGPILAEFMMLMHGDYDVGGSPENWASYLDDLSRRGVLRGGSAIGAGFCLRMHDPIPEVTQKIVGYVKLEVRDADHVLECVRGNPVYEAGGTVEIRELPATD